MAKTFTFEEAVGAQSPREFSFEEAVGDAPPQPKAFSYEEAIGQPTASAAPREFSYEEAVGQSAPTPAPISAPVVTQATPEPPIGGEMYAAPEPTVGSYITDAVDWVRRNAPIIGGHEGVVGDPIQEAIDATATRQQRIARGPDPSVGAQAVGDFSRGVDQLQGLGYGLISMAGEAVGSEAISNYGIEGYQANQAEAQQNPPVVGSYRNIQGAGDVGRYAVEAIAENLPQLAPSLVGGGVGAVVAKKAGQNIALGSVAGAYPVAAGLNAAETYGNIYDKTGERAPGTSAVAGAVSGALDVVPTGLALTRALGDVAANKVKQGLVKRLGAGVAEQVLTEGPTEGLQTFISKVAAKSVDPNQTLFSDDDIAEYIDSVAKGSIGSAPIGLASSAIREVRAPQAPAHQGAPNAPQASTSPQAALGETQYQEMVDSIGPSATVTVDGKTYRGRPLNEISEADYNATIASQGAPNAAPVQAAEAPANPLGAGGPQAAIPGPAPQAPPAPQPAQVRNPPNPAPVQAGDGGVGGQPAARVELRYVATFSDRAAADRHAAETPGRTVVPMLGGAGFFVIESTPAATMAGDAKTPKIPVPDPVRSESPALPANAAQAKNPRFTLDDLQGSVRRTPGFEATVLKPVDPPTDEHQAVRELAQALGTTVQFVDGGKPLPLPGMAGLGKSQTVFIDSRASGEQGLMQLFGHEFYHDLEDSDPTIWDEARAGTPDRLVKEGAEQYGRLPGNNRFDPEAEGMSVVAERAIRDAIAGDPAKLLEIARAKPSVATRIMAAAMRTLRRMGLWSSELSRWEKKINGVMDDADWAKASLAMRRAMVARSERVAAEIEAGQSKTPFAEAPGGAAAPLKTEAEPAPGATVNQRPGAIDSILNPDEGGYTTEGSMTPGEVAPGRFSTQRLLEAPPKRKMLEANTAQRRPRFSRDWLAGQSMRRIDAILGKLGVKPTTIRSKSGKIEAILNLTNPSVEVRNTGPAREMPGRGPEVVDGSTATVDGDESVDAEFTARTPQRLLPAPRPMKLLEAKRPADGSDAGTLETPEDVRLEDRQSKSAESLLSEDAAVEPATLTASRSLSETDRQRDMAVTNVPLSKRGNIDAQIAAYKAKQAAEATAKRRADAITRREDKAIARELFKQHGRQLAESAAAKSGKPVKEALRTLDTMVKWEPSRAREMLEKWASDSANASKTEVLEDASVASDADAESRAESINDARRMVAEHESKQASAPTSANAEASDDLTPKPFRLNDAELNKLRDEVSVLRERLFKKDKTPKAKQNPADLARWNEIKKISDEYATYNRAEGDKDKRRERQKNVEALASAGFKEGDIVSVSGYSFPLVGEIVASDQPGEYLVERSRVVDLSTVSLVGKRTDAPAQPPASNPLSPLSRRDLIVRMRKAGLKPTNKTTKEEAIEALSGDSPAPPPSPTAPGGTTGGAGGGEGRQAWEMTREEYVRLDVAMAENVLKQRAGSTGFKDAAHRRQFELGAESNHYMSVEYALRKGKPVPPSVLADYPDLAEKPATDAAPAANQPQKKVDASPREGGFSIIAYNDTTDLVMDADFSEYARIRRIRKRGGGVAYKVEPDGKTAGRSFTKDAGGNIGRIDLAGEYSSRELAHEAALEIARQATPAPAPSAPKVSQGEGEGEGWTETTLLTRNGSKVPLRYRNGTISLAFEDGPKDVTGKIFEYEGMTLAVHRVPEGTYVGPRDWRVSEVSTGREVASGESEAGAVIYARMSIDDDAVAKTQEPTNEPDTETEGSESVADESDRGEQGDATPTRPDVAADEYGRSVNLEFIPLKVGDADAASLDATDPKDAQAIVDAYDSRSYKTDGPKALDVPSLRAVDAAYKTLVREIPSGQPDARFFALPGKAKELAVLVKKSANMIGKGAGPAHRNTLPNTLNPSGRAGVPSPYTLPKAVTKPEDIKKAILKVAAQNESRYAISGYAVSGKNLVATDGRRMFYVEGKWGKDGVYDATGTLREDVAFPPHKDVVPVAAQKRDANSATPWIDLLATIRALRKAAIMTGEESKGVLVVVNPDKTLGFAASSGLGFGEVNINSGYRVIGGINPQFFIDALEFHAKLGDESVTMWWESANKPMAMRGDNGKTITVTMPVNIDHALSKYVEDSPRFARASTAGIPDDSSPRTREIAAREWIEKGVESRFFRRWFGGSKVVDAEGKALVVYHGTAKDFHSFDPNAVGSTFEIDSTGFFFTNSSDLAEKYSDAARVIESRRGQPPVPRVVAAYLSMQNPWVIEVDTDQMSAVAHFESGNGQFNRGQQNTVAYAVDSGYDGIIIQDFRGLDGHDALLIAFSPTQIKSATGNSGEFDGANPDMRFARKREDDSTPLSPGVVRNFIDTALAKPRAANRSGVGEAVREVEPVEADEPESLAPEPETVADGDSDTPVKRASSTGGFDPDTTSARQAQIKAENEAMGFKALSSPARRSFATYAEEARQKGVIERALDLAAAVVQEPRSLKAYESVGMTIRKRQLKNRWDQLNQEIHKDDNAPDIAFTIAERNRVEQDFYLIQRALNESGSKRGEDLNSQKYTIDLDFNMVTTLVRARVAKGSPITPEQRATLESLTAKLNDKDAKLAEMQKQIDDLIATRSIRLGSRNRLKALSPAQKSATIEARVSRISALLKSGCN